MMKLWQHKLMWKPSIEDTSYNLAPPPHPKKKKKIHSPQRNGTRGKSNCQRKAGSQANS